MLKQLTLIIKALTKTNLVTYGYTNILGQSQLKHI
jgi:hypothetical protein